MNNSETQHRQLQKESLLIVTQKINSEDAVLGFFHGWVLRFAKEFTQVSVICLEEGAHDLPQNVRVFSLGKEKKKSRLQYMCRFYSYVWRERSNYDVVLVHMNPVYAILGGPLWNMLGKNIGLWYTHKMVDLKLRIAVFFSDAVLTASKESFRLPTKKLQIVGHGIDTEVFLPIGKKAEAGMKVISVGRVSSTKNQLLMVQSIQHLQKNGFNAVLEIVGSSLTPEDKVYETELRTFVKNNSIENNVIFAGDVEPKEIYKKYQSADLFINLSKTGSLDKAILEAVACGLQIITSNEAFAHIVPVQNFVQDSADIVDVVARKIVELSTKKVDPRLREYVVQNHNIQVLIPRVSTILKEL